jgi:hypothetical protein
MRPFSLANCSPSLNDTARLHPKEIPLSQRSFKSRNGTDRDVPMLEVALVADEHDRHVRIGVLTGLFEPSRQVVERLSSRNVIHEQCAGRAAVVRTRDGSERLLTGLRDSHPHICRASASLSTPLSPLKITRTVSQIWSLICLLSMLIMRAPNSTPMVRSWTGWKRLSVNWSSRQDLPTPATHRQLISHIRKEWR